MSKHYGIDGVGTLVELGKGGPKINNAAGVVEIKNNANNAYADFKAFKATLDSVQLATTPTVGSFSEGKFYYDETWKTLSVQCGRDVTLQIGQEDLCRVYNNSGALIENGYVVYATGVYSGGTNDVSTIAYAKADSAATAFVFGVATQNILDGEYGFITVRGNINGLDTNHIGAAYLVTQGMTMEVLAGGTAGNAYTFTVIDTASGGLTYTEVGGAVIVDLGGATPTRAQLMTLINTTTPSAYIEVHSVDTPGNVIVASALAFYGGVATAIGDSLYLSGVVAGKLRTTPPDYPLLEVLVGTLLTKSTTVGRVNIRVNRAYSLTDLRDVLAPTPAVDDILSFNGSEWVNKAGVVSAGAGIDFYNATPVVNSRSIPAGLIQEGTSGNGIQVNTLSKTAVLTAEQVQQGLAVNDTRAYAAWLYNTALGRTTIDAGPWAFNFYMSVNSTGAGRVTTTTRNLCQVVPVSSGSVTTSGVGANSRTATLTSGQFAGTYFAASATNTTASYLQTPTGLYQITAIASANSATITVPTGYTNENAVTFNVWNKLFGTTSPTITALATAYAEYSWSVAQPAFTVAATDKLGALDFVTSNNTTTLSVTYNGTARNSRLRTPLITLHNNLAGINAVGGNYQHLTDLQLSGLTGGTSTTLHTHAVPTTITVAVENTDTSSFPLLVTAGTGDLGPKTSTGWGLSTAHAYTGTGTATSGLPRMFLGTNAPSGDDSALLICRAIAGTDLFSHGVRDESTFTSLTTGAYASFDSIPVLNGDITYNHIASFQSRHQYAGGGTLTDSVGFSYALTTSGAVTASTAFRVYDYAGAGAVTNFYALYIPTLTKPTNHWTIYSTGTSKAYHAGNFGIGTTNPLSPLSVSGDTAAPTVFQDGNNGQVTISSPSGANTVTKLTFSTPSYGGSGANAGIGVKWTAGGTEMMFGTSNTYTGINNTALYISPAGKIGVNTILPSTLFHVSSDTQGDATFATCNASAASNVSITRSRGTEAAKTIVADTDTVGTIWFSAYDGAAYRGAAKIYAVVNGTPGSADMPGKLVFATTADGANAPSDRVTIDQAGNVGIGTSVPSSILHVYTDTDVWGIILGKVANSNIRFTGTSGGVDGIGAIQCYNNLTAKPLALLPFGGNLLVGTTDDDGTPATGRLVVQGSTNDGTTNIFVGRDTNGANVALLDTNGKLTLTGFGNAGADTYIALTRTSGYGSTYLQQCYTASGNALFGLDIINDSRTLMSLRENATGGAGIQNRHVVTFPNAYRVGIGTATPAGHLHITDDILCEFIMEAAYTHADYCPQINLKKCRTSIAAPSIVVSGDRTAIIGAMGYDGANYCYTGWMEFDVDGTPGSEDMPGRWILKLTPDGSNVPVEVVRVNNAGCVGIGTNAPSYKLDVRASSTQASVTAASVMLTTACTADASLVNTALNIDATSMAITAGVTDSNSHSGIFTSVVGEGAGFAGTQAYMFGSRCYAGIGATTAATAAVLNCYGGGFYCQNQKAGTTVTNAYAVYANSKNVATGTITNAWDFYGASATSYNYFAGSVGVGTATPSAAKLHILKQTADAALPALYISGKSLYGTGDDDYGFAYYLGYNLTSNRQLIIVDTQSNYGLRFMSNYIDGFNKTAMDRMDLNLGSDTNGVHVGTPLANTQFSASNYNGTTTKIVCEILGANAQSGNFLNISSFATPNTGDILSVASTGNMFLGTTDVDGTPPIGRLVVRGSTSDGSTNIFVARAATGGNSAWLTTAGAWACNGFSLYGLGDSTANGGMYSLYDDGVHIWVRCGTGYGCGNIIFTANIGVDHGHAASSTDPIVWIHSGTSPTGDNTEYLALSHNRTNALLDVGKGKLQVPSGVILGLDAATNTAGYIKMFAAGANAYYNTFTSGENTANANYTFPLAPPTVNGQLMSCTTAGVLSWAVAPKKTIILPAAAAALGTTTPATRETREIGTTARPVVDVLKFAHAAISFAWWKFILPDSYDGGTLTAKISYTNIATEGTTKFLFTISAACLADGGPLDVTMGTAVELEATVADTAEDVKIAAWSGAITPSGTPAGGQVILIKLQRDPADTDHDTTALDAYVLDLAIEYTTNSWTD